MKKLLCSLLCLSMLLSFAVPVLADDPVTLRIVASQPEYLAQEQEIWALFTEETGINVELITVNEDTEAAFNTQVAAGDAPDLQLYTTVDREKYTIYQNLANIDYPYWDLISYDAKGIFADTFATEEGYTPCLYPYGGVTFSFIYHSDLMEAAGLDPKATIRTFEDLDKFLADLKVYADANGYASTLDLGWHSWCIMSQMFDDLAVALGTTQAELMDVWVNRTIAWNDIEKNPYAKAFEKMKEWYDKGYLPEKWWTRSWETDYEAGFAAKRSILAYHGPWLWTKVETADPTATLSGFCFPANDKGLIQNGAVDANKGTVLFVCNEGSAKQEAAVKAFTWWNSPEIIKIRAEAFGSVPLMDMSSVGSPELASSQYNEVVKLIQEGYYGDWKFDSTRWASTAANAYRNKDGQDVLAADDMVSNYADYFEGRISLQQLLDICQNRFETYYTFE